MPSLIVDHEADNPSPAHPRIYCRVLAVNGDSLENNGGAQDWGVQPSLSENLNYTALNVSLKSYPGLSVLKSGNWTLARRMLSRRDSLPHFLSPTRTPATSFSFFVSFALQVQQVRQGMDFHLFFQSWRDSAAHQDPDMQKLFTIIFYDRVNILPKSCIGWSV